MNEYVFWGNDGDVEVEVQREIVQIILGPMKLGGVHRCTKGHDRANGRGHVDEIAFIAWIRSHC